MSEFSSYYLYQRYERRGSQDWFPCIPNTFSISGDSQSPMTITVKSDCDPQCGCSNVQYRWVNLDPSIDWICEGSAKYYKQQKQVSYDGGSTWANLNIYQRGALIDASSSDCTSPSPTIYRWAKTNDTICIYDGKFRATYIGGTTYELPCDGNPTLTSGNTKPSGYQYTAMTSAEIGDCVTSIDNEAFRFCSGLTSCTIGSGITSIGTSAFDFCKNLTNITIPSSVITIGNWAFQNCYSLTSCTIGSGATSIGESAFQQCSGLTSITIPNSVTSIGEAAFLNCFSLTSITIGNSVTSIGNAAFQSCYSLTSITCLATTPPTSGFSLFYNTNNCPIYVPSGSVNAYKSASGWSDYSSRIQAIP